MVSKPAVMPANKDRYTTDMGMDEMGRMPPPVNKSPGAPSGDMAGGRMPAPDMVNRSPGGPSGDMIGGRMPPPVNRSAVMPGNGMPAGGGAMGMGGAMGAKPFAKGGKVSAKAPVKAKAKAKSTCMKTGGMVKSSASSRGDGIAQRGRTRGKYC
jgi:hypothetical protein